MKFNQYTCIRFMTTSSNKIFYRLGPNIYYFKVNWLKFKLNVCYTFSFFTPWFFCNLVFFYNYIATEYALIKNLSSKTFYVSLYVVHGNESFATHSTKICIFASISFPLFRWFFDMNCLPHSAPVFTSMTLHFTIYVVPGGGSIATQSTNIWILPTMILHMVFCGIESYLHTQFYSYS